MAELAQTAGVSVRMIVRLESVEKLNQTVGHARKQVTAHQNKRQAMALARVLVQIARALGKNPVTAWVTSCDLPLRPLEIQAIAAAAIERQADAAGVKRAKLDSTGRLRETLSDWHERDEKQSARQRRAKDSRIQIDVEVSVKPIVRLRGVVIPYAPFGPFGDADKESSFLERFANAAIGSLDYYTSIVWRQERDFHSILSRSDEIEDDPALVLGFLQQIHREFGFGKWRFDSIPGFRVRLAFLKLEQNRRQIPWQNVLPLANERRRKNSVMTIKASVAENFLRGVCGMQVTTGNSTDGPGLHLVDSEYSLHEIAAEVAAFFARFGSNAVLVLDQCTADSLATLADLRLHDWAADSDASVPSYPLGIATREHGTVLRDFLRRVIRNELFLAHSAIMAVIYADYVARTIERNSALLHLISEALSGAEHDLVLPSYLRIVADPRWRLEATFLQTLLQEIARRLRGIAETTPERLQATASKFFDEAVLEGIREAAV